MKKILGLLFVLLLLSISFTVMADEGSVTLINKGETITTTYPVIERNGDYFIAADDLSLINIDCKVVSMPNYNLGRLNGPYTASFNIETGSLLYNGRYYNDIVLIENETIYLSLSQLIDIYSSDLGTSIDTENNILSLWVNDYKTATRWITYEINSDIPIDKNGFEVELYNGFKKNASVSYGSGGNFYPETFSGVDLTDYPSKTDIFNIGSSHSITSSETYTFYDNARTYTYHYDTAVNQNYIPDANSGNTIAGGSLPTSSGGGASKNGYTTVGMKVYNDKYIGGTFERLSSEATVVELKPDDVAECVTVSGSITIPSHSEDIEYNVIGQISDTKYIDMVSGIISARETSVDYKLRLLPEDDYTICVRFTDNNFMRQSIEYKNLTSDKVVDFKDFVVSKEITGKIKLPDGITSVTDVYNNALDTLSGYIILQGADENHSIVGREYVDISVKNGYADFVMRDDIGIENGLISFSMHSDAKEVYSAGVYSDNSTIKYVAEDGTPIPTDTKNIVLNIAKGKVIIIDINCDVCSRTEMYLDIARSEEETKLENCPLYIEAMETDILYDNEEYTHTLRFTAVIPDDLSYYRPYMCDTLELDYITYLDNNNEWVNNIDSSSFISLEKLVTHYNGYEPSIPLEVSYKGYSADEGYCYGFYVDSLFDYDGIIYIAYYGENNKLLHIESQPQTFENYENYKLYFKLDSTYEPLSKEIKMFVWTDALRPLSKLMYIKQP